MPIPQPHADEQQQDFISRCAGDKTMNADYTDPKQRVAICYQQWRDRHKQAAKSAIAGLREALQGAGRVFGSRKGGVTPRRPVAASQRPLAGYHPVVDFGPGLRRRPIRDQAGTLLREADVEVNDLAVDPRHPNRRLRRAYRVDPVDTLKRTGLIGIREVDAAAELRRQLERMVPGLGGGSALRITISAFLVEPIKDDHIRASRKLREATAALGHLWPPVLWICLGGTVQGYREHRRIGTRRAADIVANGMQRLADHFYGAE